MVKLHVHYINGCFNVRCFKKQRLQKQTWAGISPRSFITGAFLGRSGRGFGTGHSPCIEPNLMKNMLSCLSLLNKLISLTESSSRGESWNSDQASVTYKLTSDQDSCWVCDILSAPSEFLKELGVLFNLGYLLKHFHIWTVCLCSASQPIVCLLCKTNFRDQGKDENVGEGNKQLHWG